MKRTLFNRFMCDQDGKVVAGQMPNLPIVGWLLFAVLGMLTPYGSTHNGFHYLSQAFLFVWAYLEIRSGESMFRRVLGLIVLIIIITNYFK